MTDVMERTPKAKSVETGVQDTESLAIGLKDILADTYQLIFKTHAYHWNVTGSLFFSIHALTEEHYSDMFAAADVIAERIRALGEVAPMTFSELNKDTRIMAFDGIPTAGEMVTDLLSDHEQLAHRLHALIELAESHKDPVTADLATERSAFHEKAAWMLRATAA